MGYAAIGLHNPKTKSNYCLNLAAAVNVVLYDRQLKEIFKENSNG